MHLIESKVAVFKGTRGLSDYELFVGNFDHVEVVHFALESSANKLVSLGEFYKKGIFRKFSQKF